MSIPTKQCKFASEHVCGVVLFLCTLWWDTTMSLGDGITLYFSKIFSRINTASKQPPFYRRQILAHCHEKICSNIALIVTGVYFQRPNFHHVSSGSEDDGLDRLQAIIWTNNDPDHCRGVYTLHHDLLWWIVSDLNFQIHRSINYTNAGNGYYWHGTSSGMRLVCYSETYALYSRYILFLVVPCRSISCRVT